MWELSLPIIVGQLGTILMGTTDTAMIGQVGATELAACGVANSVFFIVAIVGIGGLIVMTPLISQAKGANDAQECGNILKSGLVVAGILGVVLALIILFLTLNFQWFGQPPLVDSMARSYLFIVSFSVIPMLIFLACRNFTDGLTFTKIAMSVTLAGLLMNVVLNWILIYGKFGFPALGLDGAGYATFISRIAMAAFIWIYVFRSKKTKAFLPESSHIDKKEVFKIFKLGIPGGMQLFFEVGAFAGAAIVIGWLGTNSLAAHNVVISIASLTYMIAAGISAATSIRVGTALGERNRAGVLLSGRTGLLMVIIFTSFTCATFLLFDKPIVAIFNTNPEVVKIAAGLMFMAALFQISDGMQVVALGGLRALSDVKLPTAITLMAYWGVGLPMGWWCAFYLKMGAMGVWVGLTAGLLFSAVFMTSRFFAIAKKKNLNQI